MGQFNQPEISWKHASMFVRCWCFEKLFQIFRCMENFMLAIFRFLKQCNDNNFHKPLERFEVIIISCGCFGNKSFISYAVPSLYARCKKLDGHEQLKVASLNRIRNSAKLVLSHNRKILWPLKLPTCYKQCWVLGWMLVCSQLLNNE